MMSDTALIEATEQPPAVPGRRLSLGRPTAVAAVVVLTALLAAGALFWWGQEEPLPDDAAFAVGGQVVTVDELDRRVELMGALYGVQAPTDDRRADFRRDSAKSFAIQMVLEDKAEDLGVVIADTAVRRKLEAYLVDQLGSGRDARDEFVRILGNVGVSEDEVLDEVRQQLALARLFDDVTGDVTIDDVEVRAAYDRMGDRLGTPERRRVLNIVVSSRDRAVQLMKQLREGREFQALARRFSIDGSTRDSGGNLGLVSEDMVEGAYADAAFGATTGGLFGPVETEHGWNVGKVVQVRPGVNPGFAAAEDQVRRLAVFDKRLEAWKDWVQQTLKDAGIRYADDYRPDDPYALPTEARPNAQTSADGVER